MFLCFIQPADSFLSGITSHPHTRADTIAKVCWMMSLHESNGDDSDFLITFRPADFSKNQG